MTRTKISFAYKSGFRRLWLVVSVVWIIAVATLVATDRNVTLLEMLSSMAIPVAALYAIGVAAAWVIEGFAKVE